MPRIRFPIGLVALCCSTALSWGATITGTYCGAVLSSGEMTDVVTRFVQESDGKISGS